MKKFLIFILLLTSNVALSQIGSIGGAKTLKVQNLNDALKSCAHANGYTDSVELSSILTLDCSNRNFIDKSLNGIADIKNLEELNLSHNNLLTDVSILYNLNNLRTLDLSFNTSLNITKYSWFTKYQVLWLTNMGLTNLPKISKSASLKEIFLSNNKLSSALSNLPSSLQTLDVSNNLLTSCTNLIGKTIKSLKLEGNSLTSLNNCNQINGLETVSVKNTPNLAGEFNIDSVGGYCKLSISNTSYTSITGSRPILILEVSNNDLLQTVDLIKKSSNTIQNTYPDLMPQNVSYFGTNNLNCSNLYNTKQLWDTHSTVNMDTKIVTTSNSITLTSPVCTSEILTGFVMPDSCKADPLTSITALHDNNTQRTFVSWEKDVNHDFALWGVTKFKVTAYNRGGTIIEEIDVPIADGLSVFSTAVDVSKYSVSACIIDKCGYEIETQQISYSGNAINSFDVYEDINTQRRYITWEKNESFDFEFWGINSFEIKGLLNGNVVYRRVVTVDAIPNYLVSNSLKANIYKISACTNDSCNQVRSDTLFAQGLTRAIETNVFWNTPGLDPESFTYRIRFKYPNFAFNTLNGIGKPTYFKITPDFVQGSIADMGVTITVTDPNRNGNCEQSTNGNDNSCNGDSEIWVSQLLQRNQFIGNSFTIVACNELIGCGAGASLNLGNPLTDSQLPIPQWEDVSDQTIGTGTQIILDWNESLLNEKIPNTDTYLVDYLEVTEEQPFIPANHLFGEAATNVTNVFYIDRGTGSSFIDREKISRVTKGKYYFTLKACHRNRELGDTCSFGSTKILKTLNRGEINSAPSIPTNINFVTYDSITQTNKALVWDKLTSPDYYYVSGFLSGVPASPVAPICSSGNGASSVNNDNKSGYLVTLNSGSTQDMLSSVVSCKNITGVDYFSWTVQACYSGLGCSLPSTPLQSDTPAIGTIENPFPSSTTNSPNSVGGPGDMNPGSWWNPLQAGTGWHFYWASELRYPSVHERYGNTYDLLGVWYTYKLVDDVWTPIWIFSHLKETQVIGSAKFFEGSLNYFTRAGGVTNSRSIGRLQVYFGVQTGDNNIVRLNIDLDSENGIISQDIATIENRNDCTDYYGYDICIIPDDNNGTINIPLINFDVTIKAQPSVYEQTGNNADHYSGLWWDERADGTINEDYMFMIDVNKGLEWRGIITYDGNGDPIWAVSSNCVDNYCSNTQAGYTTMDFHTVPTGFNPLMYAPEGYITQDYSVSVGSGSRTLNSPQDLREIKLGATNLSITSAQLPSRGAGASLSIPANTFLDKGASFHDIRFFINGNDESVTTCDPNVDGECVVKFTWYTDDYFPSIEPFYKRGTGPYLPLSGLCGNATPPDVFVVTDYQCTITIPGTYTFQLRKANYISPFNKDVVIAESQNLEVIECTTTNCVIDETIVNSSVETFIGPDEIVIGGNGNGNGILELSDLPTAPSSSSTVGATAGSFNVSTNGAATYSIPIMTAPASGGLAPNFSLNYSSQSSKSSMGQGWSIGGYSIINRCPQTYDQDYDAVSDDPLVLSVNFTSSDRFCVDGKRLFLESGTYGADGAVYKTEINDFIKYTSSGSQGGSPTCFKAEHKNGNIVYYGNCNLGANEEQTALVDSVLTLVPADNPAFAWAQSRMIDVAGNYYDIAYHSGRVTTFDASCNPAEFDESTIEFYPKKVYYSGNTVASQTTKDSIEFVYESQIKCLGFYNEIDGDAISTNPTIKHLRNNRRLLRVDSKSNNEDLRSYKLNYTEYFPGGTGVNDGLSPFKVLSSIQECTDSNFTTCYQPTAFNWDTGSIKSIGASAIDPNSPYLEFSNFYDDPSPTLSEDYYVRPYDANGDGQTDFALRYKIAHDTFVNKLAIADGTGGYNMITPPVNIATSGNARKIVDINGDGFNDIAAGGQVYLWNGTNYDTPITLGFNADNFFDLDGDGLPEAIEYIAVGAFPNIEHSFRIHKNILGATHDLNNIFESEFKLMKMNIDDFNYIDGGQIIVDLEPFDITEISDVFDDNGDGISEILIKVGYEVCFDEANSNFPCLNGSSYFLEQWAIARLELINSEWIYKIESLEPTTSCSSRGLCGEGITKPVFVDLNNDGAQEMCYVNNDIDNEFRYFKDWKCFERGNNVVGLDFGYKTIFSKSFTVDVSTSEYFNQISYEDYNGDGLIDLMFSKGNQDDSTWSVIYTNSFNGEFKIEENSVHTTNIIAGRGQPSDPHITRDGFKLDKHLFIDVNNDGLKDSLLFKYDPNDLTIKVYKTMGTISGGSINSKDKITSITQGLGKNIEIEYKPMSDVSVYTRENNSVNAWYGSGKTPVYDYISQMSLVSEYSIDLPAHDIAASDLSGPSSLLPNMLQTYQYHYYGAKIQAGGRGFLGFKTFEVYDSNNSILNQTDYHQEFPFTGLAYKEQKYFIEPNSSPALLRAAIGENKLIPCWVNGNCEPVIPPIDPCLKVTGFICNTSQLASLPTGAKLISSVDSQWKEKDITVGAKNSVFIYPEIVATDQYELDGSSQIGRTVVGTQYNEDAANDYGNPTQIIETTYNNGSLTALLTKTTDLDYFYTTATNYVVDRAKTKTTAYSRPTTGNDQIRKTAYTYDSNNLLFTEKQTSGSDTAKYVQKKYATRDNFGNTTKIELTATSATTRTTENTFDTQGRYVVKTIAGGQLQSNVVSRDKFGNPTVVENQQGIATFYSYDDFGSLFYKIDELGQWQQTTKTMGSGSYCSGTGAEFYTTTTSIQPTTWACIDELGRNIRTITQGFAPGSVIYVDKHFDISGNLLEQSMPRFSVPLKTDASHWQRNAYDAFKRPLKTRNANGDITLYTYSPLVSEVTNALFKTTTTTSNMLGEVVSVTDADLAVTTYAYDDIGRQVSIDGPLSGTVDKLITHYDSFDNVDSIDDPDLGVWTYHYNLYGELQYQRDAKTNCTVLTYDNLGRTTSKSYKKNANVDCSLGDFEGQNIFIFDNTATSSTFGLMTQENNQKMIKNYFYDGLSRLETVTTNYIGEGIAGTDLITTQDSYYDEYSRPLAQYDATEQSVRFEYNGQGYPTKTIDQFSNTVFEQVMGQDAFGNIKTVKAGNEVSTTKTFDKIGRVKSIFTTHPTQIIQSLNYDYDAVGNLNSREDARDPGNVFYEEFSYDSVNRLEIVKARTGAVPLTVTMSFSYDEGGRITNFNGNNYSYTGSSVHGVSSITGNTSKSFSYDANGNQENSDGRTLIYSAFNKTTHMDKGVASVDFVYGSGNNRIKRVDVGSDENETTYYIGNVEMYYDNNHNPIKTKRYIGNTVITHYLATNNQEIKYLHKDHLGSIQSVTSEIFSAITTDHLSFDAFGRRRDASNNSLIINYNPIADVTKKGFTGQEHIDQLGVINFNARLYDPELGIMLQADTIIPDGPVTQSLNRYSYVFNNPLSYTDPTGHAAIWSSTFEQDIVENAAKQARFFEGVRERNTQKEAENSKSDDAKIETPVGGNNNGTFRGNGLGILASPDGGDKDASKVTVTGSKGLDPNKVDYYKNKGDPANDVVSTPDMDKLAVKTLNDIPKNNSFDSENVGYINTDKKGNLVASQHVNKSITNVGKTGQTTQAVPTTAKGIYHDHFQGTAVGPGSGDAGPIYGGKVVYTKDLNGNIYKIEYSNSYKTKKNNNGWRLTTLKGKDFPRQRKWVPGFVYTKYK